MYSESNHLILSTNDVIDKIYKIHKSIGRGAFSTVYSCKNLITEQIKALKVVRNERRFHKQVKMEIELHELLKKSERMCDNFLYLNESFKFNDNIFLVFDNFGINLYKYYKTNSLLEYDIYLFSKQIANGLNYLHENKIIHGDLKHENILIHNKLLKIIDIGSSFKEKNNLYKSYIQSRFYRSPEVIFNLPITIKIDIWSYACIIYELITKQPLFPARSSKDLVLYFVHVLDYPIDDNFYNDNKYFSERKKLYTFKNYNAKIFIPNNFQWNIQLFYKDLILKCLNWDYKNRFSAHEILDFLIEYSLKVNQ